ncbi:hypothetical protein KAI32_00335 [Candidatus Pacearchaeota archaeon]|nr:hypothetical protein [Candidatus Pacearchaeota archaeon]
MPEQKKKVKYSYAGKESLEEVLYRSFPDQLRPTKKTNTYFGVIFLLVLVIAFVEFPYGSLATGDTDVTINVGYPWPFLQFSLTDMETSPLKIGGLIIDLILYFFIAYLADVATNLILKNPLLISKEDFKKRPKVFEDKKARTMAEKLTEKVAKKTLPPNPDNLQVPSTDNSQSPNQTILK